MSTNKKRKGFSLAEVMITLLIVGVVGAAAIPTVTKGKTGTDKMWDWADYPLGAGYSVGSHVLLDSSGNAVPVPTGGYFPNDLRPLGMLSENVINNLNGAIQGNAPQHDKLVLVNNLRENNPNDTLAIPHISLYSKNGETIDYAGSLRMNESNMALGVGASQRMLSTEVQSINNTAVGHYALFNNSMTQYNTALGSMALSSISGSATDNSYEGSSVAIGSQSLMYHTKGHNNTAVGFRTLNAITEGHRNLALGSDALNVQTVGSYAYENNNIAIGYRAGYVTSQNVDDNETPNNSSNLFIGNSAGESNPLISANMLNNSEFDINADELIVNTADGKHTILKIRMIDDEGVDLPIKNSADINDYTLNNTYCLGEGSEDLAKLKENSNDTGALAEVCIAKFNNGVHVIPRYQQATGSMSVFSVDWQNAIKGNVLNNKQKIVPAEWDIFLKNLDIAYDCGISSGVNVHCHIQTVKAGLNYIERFKEGPGFFNRLFTAISVNLKCAISSFFGSDECENQELVIGSHTNFETEIQSLFDKMTTSIQEAVQNFVNLPSLFDSDIRLKNVFGKSTAGLKEINALKIKNYTYKADKEKTPHVGVIAQELQKVFPNSVIEGPDGYLRIKQEEIFYAMVNSIKELDKQDQQLKVEIPKVNKQINTVVEQNKKLLTKNEMLKIENEKLQAQLKELNVEK